MEINKDGFLDKIPGGGDDFLSKVERIVTGIQQIAESEKVLRQPVQNINNGQHGLGDIAKLFDALEKAGMGDQRLSEVINKLPFTVKQLKEMISGGQ